MSDYNIATNPPTILSVVLIRSANAISSTQIPLSGTGLLSVTAGTLDTAATLRARVAADPANLRTDLGLGNAATKNVGTTAGTVCAGDDARLSAGVSDGDKGDITVSASGTAWTIDADAKAAFPVSTAQAAANAVVASGASFALAAHETDTTAIHGIADTANLLVSGGALGTPASGVATNLTGTAAGLTAGNVTTNANLTGDVTSVGNAATIPTSVISAAARTVTDDATVAAMVDTLGGEASTGSGGLVRKTNPTLITPALGVATATSLNGLTVTSSTGTLTVTNGKTISFSNGITFAGTDSTTMTFPTTSATIARTDTGQTLTGSNIFVPASSGATPVTLRGAAAQSASLLTFQDSALVSLYQFMPSAIGFQIGFDSPINSYTTTIGGNRSYTIFVSGMYMRSDFQFRWYDATNLNGSADVFLRRRSAANLCQGGSDTTTAVAQTRSVQSVTGASNVAGALLTIKDSAGTGTAASGGISIQVAPAGASSSTTNAHAEAIGIASTKAVTFAGIVINQAQVRLKGYTVATLPTPTQGDYAFVTDATAPTFGATVAGGGAVVTPVFYDGTNWTCR